MSQQENPKVDVSEERIKELVELLDGVNNEIVESILTQYKRGYDLSPKQVSVLVKASERQKRSIERGYSGIDEGLKDGVRERAIDIAGKDKYVPMPLPMVRDTLDEYGLDTYEFRLYAHIVRRTSESLKGDCSATLKDMSDVTKMSVRRLQYALKTLCDAGLILKETRRGDADSYYLAPVSNWVAKRYLEAIRKKAKAHLGTSDD